MSFDRICFDFDSTLSKIEGIDELAKRAGMGEEMARLTDQAMNGELPLEAVYGHRLEMIKPDKQAIEWLADEYIREKVADVETLFSELTALGKSVYIVSGGIRQAIWPMASLLNLPESHVFAVDIFFNDDGSYRDFDRASTLARAGGKAHVCKQLSQTGQRLAMVGDGKTDLESKQAGAFFIGFGGVVARPIVQEQADYFISEPSLLAVLDYLR